MSVNSYYKHHNQAFDFRSSTTDTSLQVIICDFNSHNTEWGYISTNDDGTLVERWCDANSLTLIHDPKLHKSFYSARWKQGYNPDQSFVSTSLAHQCEKLVLEVIPKTQHRPIAIKIKATTPPQEVPFRRRYNLKKADWEGFDKSVDMSVTDSVPTPDNDGSFEDLIKKASRQQIPRGCPTSYICGLTDESTKLYEDYKMQLKNDPFNSETTETGNRISDEIVEAQKKKWQTLIESTDFTHSSRKAWETINKLSKDHA